MSALPVLPSLESCTSYIICKEGICGGHPRLYLYTGDCLRMEILTHVKLPPVCHQPLEEWVQAGKGELLVLLLWTLSSLEQKEG